MCEDCEVAASQDAVEQSSTSPASTAQPDADGQCGRCGDGPIVEGVTFEGGTRREAGIVTVLRCKKCGHIPEE